LGEAHCRRFVCGWQVAMILAYWREMALYYERHRDDEGA
jgi:hypothetical protein